MAYFADLSDYIYVPRFARTGCVNVGWLARTGPFSTEAPSESLLDALWAFCSIAVVPTRGIHECGLCDPARLVVSTRVGRTLLLGTSEIRVFGTGDRTFAAPSLIYHYVEAHHYCPPAEFVHAATEGLTPPRPDYLQRLGSIGLDWAEASDVDPELKLIRFTALGRLECCSRAGGRHPALD